MGWHYDSTRRLEILGEVGEDDVSSGSANRKKGLISSPSQVSPAFLGGGVNLGVFARDLVSGKGKVGVLP